MKGMKRKVEKIWINKANNLYKFSVVVKWYTLKVIYTSVSFYGFFFIHLPWPLTFYIGFLPEEMKLMFFFWENPK